jgi:mannosyltransferase
MLFAGGAAMRTVAHSPPTIGDLSAGPTLGAERARVAASAGAGAVLATVIVARHLGTKPLWRDEAISVSVATRSVLRILSVLPHHDANAGVYYGLLHFWLRMAGAGTTGARSLSGACFVATAAVVGWAAARWRGWEMGLAGGLLVATNPFLLYYGQEARPYALAVLLAALSAVALFWRRDRPAAGWYVATTVALVYVDLFAILFAAAMAGAVLLAHLSRRLPVPKVLIRSWIAIAAASAPMAAVMLLGERGQISWLGHPTIGDLTRTVTSMSSGWLGLALMLGLGAAAAVGLRRDRPAVGALAAAFAVPPLGLWSVAQIVPSFIDRYVICSAVALIGLVAAGLSVVREWAGRLAAMVVLAALVVLGMQRIATVEATPFKVDNAPAVVAFIGARARPGDVIGYAGGGLRILVDASRHGQQAFPPDVALAPGGEEYRQHDLYAREVSPAVLEQRLATVQRLWLLTDPSDLRYPQGGPFAVLRSRVSSEFQARAGGSFGAVDVTLLVRPGA